MAARDNAADDAAKRPTEPTRDEVGSLDLTAVIEATIEALPHARRLYPDTYAHLITRAVLDHLSSLEDRLVTLCDRSDEVMAKVWSDMDHWPTPDDEVGPPPPSSVLTSDIRALLAPVGAASDTTEE